MMEYKCSITTRKLRDGRFRSKIYENGVQVSIRDSNVDMLYRSLYKTVTNTHKQVIMEGDLEQITTEFKSPIKVRVQ